jgi:sterol desaturase/sphingolipid hydroxylase (fatty acid hydroxylase superfamily)
VNPEALRLAVLLGGFGLLLASERAAPHHGAVVPRAPRWRRNLSLGALNGVVTGSVCAACFALVGGRAAFGLFAPLGAAHVFAEVLALDLLTYALHRAYHRVPLLWRFHRVHHTDRDLDASSSFRFHVGEVLLSGVAKLGFVVLLGVSPFGLLAFEMSMGFASQLQHANVALPRPLERAMWLVFVPPAMHRVHHHPLRAATDSNYGTLVSLWDRLLGTLRRDAPSDREFGLPDFPAAERISLASLLALPFARRRPLPLSPQ